MKTGAELIIEERKRQIEEEGWTAEHDKQHESGELALVAALYAAPVPLYTVTITDKSVKWQDPWPWENGIDPPRGGPLIYVPAWDKRDEHDQITKLKIAGALIAAEIDRIQIRDCQHKNLECTDRFDEGKYKP